MISDNLWPGQVVRLTGLEKRDARTFSSWHNDAGFLRLVDAELARPRSEDDCLRTVRGVGERPEAQSRLQSAGSTTTRWSSWLRWTASCVSMA